MTQRTAHMDLDWKPCDAPGFDYVAELPEIPGYPDSAPDVADGGAFAYVGPYTGLLDGSYLFCLDIAVPDNDQCVFFNNDFNIPNADTEDEMMGIVEDLSVEQIAEKLAEDGYKPVDDDVVASRNASMDVDWWQTSAGTWAGTLPEIPGYPKPGGGRYTVALDTIVNDDDEIIGYGFDMNIIGPGVVAPLNEETFGFGFADTVEEAKQEVESLSPEEIADAATAKGGEPVDATASRQASRRTARMDLDWREEMNKFGDLMYTAALPAIPGYPYSGDGNSTVGIAPNVYDTTGELYTWWMDIEVGKNDNVRFYDNELTGMGPYPLDYQMGYLDGLSVEWIAGKLAEKGYEPEED